MLSLDCPPAPRAEARCLLPVSIAAVLFVLFGLLPIELQYSLLPSYVTEERYLREVLSHPLHEYTRSASEESDLYAGLFDGNETATGRID